MRRMICVVAGLAFASLPTVAEASDCTAAFCPRQSVTVLSPVTAVAATQQAIAVQSVAVPTVVVQRAAPVVVRQRVVTLRRAPIRNFLFGQRNVVRVRSRCR